MSDRLQNLPDWARALVESTRAAAPAAPAVRRESDAWRLLLDAATMSTFLPRELDPSASLEGSQRRSAEESVLQLSELAGARWSLTRDSRRRILAQCEPEELRAAIDRKPPDARDPLTNALREYLGNSETDLQSLSIEELEARRVAASWLRGIDRIPLPPLDELDRQIELRRLLAPLERMIGRKPGRPDRFFGRSDEIEELREYVRVIKADSVTQAVTRGVIGLARYFRGRKPKTVWGTGGVGKTTLIAYFMLEHAHAAKGRFPFAYLDFDRSTISARNRASLLSEIARQVGAQFPQLTETMTALRRDLEEVARKIERSPESDSVALLQPYALRFRVAVNEHFDDEPFLLVFDTFEVVQYSADQVRALEELVRAFTTTDDGWGASDESTPIWGRLRLIISGRRRVAEFLGGAEELELGPLDPEGSAQMLEALAADAGKKISLADARKLVEAIRKDSGDRSGKGVRPLRLRLVGELFREEAEDGPAIVQSLLGELSNPNAEQKKLGALFIDGILVRRILGHVRDARVRELADPGLVVRRITKDVIREVMTRGTRDSWIVNDEEAQEIFEAFQREVSLVENDGDALRHRQDVRAEMLPLIHKRRPEAFLRIHSLAYEFFRVKDDPASAEEAIYHGLWLRRPLEELDALYRRRRPVLRIDPDEFAHDSPANLYLRARNDDPLLAAGEVAQLPHPVRADWLSRRAHAWLEEKRLNEQTLTIRVVAGSDSAVLDERKDVAAPVARLLFRAGEWADAARLLQRHVGREFASDPDSQSLLRTWATLVAKSGIDAREHLPWITLAASECTDLVVRTEVLAHAALASGESVSTAESITAVTPLGTQMTRAASNVRSSVWPRELRTLRLAIAAHPPYGVEGLLTDFVRACEELPHDRSVAELVGSMLGQPVSLRELDMVWRREKLLLLSLAMGDPQKLAQLRRIATSDYGDWFLPFGNALARALGSENAVRQMRALLPKGWPPEAQRAFERRDGLTAVQILTAEGLLLEFAERLASSSSGEPAHFPSTAPEIAAALVRWRRLTS
ncbi:MAG TPA: hypothetical protein VEK11_11825 [Thermoanaerobaculia bacterium]|nr:hypothetical protein [Thermoanaerobaculia bacterium]